MQFSFEDSKIFPAMKGLLLIAHPGLRDPNFTRTVVLICDHSDKGAVGIILNRELDVKLEQAFPSEIWAEQKDQKFFQGGPVALSQLFIVHNEVFTESQNEETISIPVMDGIVFTENPICLDDEFFQPSKIKFFLGNSGWGAGQLEAELLLGGWIVGKATPSLIFDTPTHRIWSKALQDLGEPYSLISTWPTSPGLN